MYCSKCGSPLLPDALFCSRCGASVAGVRRVSAAKPVTVRAAQPATLGMKWYGFLTHFFLPFFAIASGITFGFTYVFRYIGALFGAYTPYSALMDVVSECKADLPRFVLDAVIFAAILWLACYGIAVRERLINFDKNAGAGVSRFFAADAVIAVASLAERFALDMSWDDFGTLFFSSLITVGVVALDVIAAVNSKTYFEKRASLFNN